MSPLLPLLNLKGKSLDEGHLALSGRARIPLYSADILLCDRENWLEGTWEQRKCIRGHGHSGLHGRDDN